MGPNKLEQNSVGSSAGQRWPKVPPPPVLFFFTRLFRKMNCAEKTVRNKIGKMTYLHIYFDSYGVTKFTKSQRYGWQVGFCIGCSKNNSLIQALVFTKTFVPKLRSKDGSFWPRTYNFIIILKELVGVFGGVVGLCMGFSLLSGAEFIYFFTLRLLDWEDWISFSGSLLTFVDSNRRRHKTMIAY